MIASVERWPDVRVTAAQVIGLAGLVVVAAASVGSYWVMNNSTYDVWGGLLVLPWLVVLSLPLLWFVHRNEHDAFVARLITAAFVAKLVSSYLRFHVSFNVYERTDSAKYVEIGRGIADTLRAGGVPDLSVTGTQFIELVTGFVIFASNPSTLGGFLVFAWLSFFGSYLFYRAFVIGVEHGRARRYAAALFFLPTMLFWPSSIGKEAWMVLVLGIAAYGAARVLARQTLGYPILLLGVAGAMVVRPHVAAIVCASALGAFVIARGDGRGLLRRVVGPAVIIAVSALVLAQANEFFEIDLTGGDVASIEHLLDETDRRSGDTGGSVFDNRPVRSPADLPAALVTVPFRPFPSEAHNSQALLTSLEGVFLLLLLLLSSSRLLRAVREVRRTPYVTFALLYTILFAIAFSNVGNFGILARQRATLYPFLLVLVALPRLKEMRARSGADGPGRTAAT